MIGGSLLPSFALSAYDSSIAPRCACTCSYRVALGPLQGTEPLVSSVDCGIYAKLNLMTFQQKIFCPPQSLLLEPPDAFPIQFSIDLLDNLTKIDRYDGWQGSLPSQFIARQHGVGQIADQGDF